MIIFDNKVFLILISCLILIMGLESPHYSRGARVPQLFEGVELGFPHYSGGAIVLPLFRGGLQFPHYSGGLESPHH